MCHGILKETAKLFALRLQLGSETRGQHENTSLWNGTFDQGVNMLAAEAEILQATWLVAKIGQEL